MSVQGRRPAALLAAIVSATILITTAGAEAAPSSADRLDLGSRNAIDSYLLGIGVDPQGVVVQRGSRNYAGPACPGRRWTCTTARRVLQIAPAGGTNRAVAATQQQQPDCAVTQSPASPVKDNEASCVQRHHTSPAQDCTIVQTNTTGDNRARVEQVSQQSDGSAQSSVQRCTVTQTSHGGDNVLFVRQEIGQVVTSGTAQTQDAYQRLDVKQATSGGGTNEVHVEQTQRQQARGGTLQRQNTHSSPLQDCHVSEFSPTDPNACVNISQVAVHGGNAVQLRQRADQDARTTALATQQQGLPAGGIDARVHQETRTGTSTNEAQQAKSQVLAGAPGSSQTQFDPTSCCGVGSQVGGVGNSETIDQTVTMSASEGRGAAQAATVVGASSSPAGSCSITQRVDTETGRAREHAFLKPCPLLILTTTCAGGTGHHGPSGCTTVKSTTAPTRPH